MKFHVGWYYPIFPKNILNRFCVMLKSQRLLFKVFITHNPFKIIWLSVLFTKAGKILLSLLSLFYDSLTLYNGKERHNLSLELKFYILMSNLKLTQAIAFKRSQSKTKTETTSRNKHASHGQVNISMDLDHTVPLIKSWFYTISIHKDF